MAQRLVDDLDNSQFADGTVTFALDGTVYDIDLSTKNAEKLKNALEPFTTVARPRVGATVSDAPGRQYSTERPKIVSRSHKTPTGRAEQLAAIRDWAKQEGYEISDRGRIPEAVVEAFNAVHARRKDDKPITPTFSSVG